MDTDFSPNDIDGDGVDLRRIFSLLWQWAWLIALCGVLAGGIGYLVSRSQTPYYSSTATILVNTAASSKTYDYSAIVSSTKLVSTYINMMTTGTVLEEVTAELGLGMSLESLQGDVSVSSVSGTDLIKVTVETTDPQFSATIANTLVDVFSRQIQEIQMERFGQSKDSLEIQIADMEQRIAELEKQTSNTMPSEERQNLDTKLTQYRGIYSNLIISYENVRLAESQNATSIVTIEAAHPNNNPVRPEPLKTGILAGAVGLLVAAGVLFLIDTLDDTVRTPDDIQRKFNLPVLGFIYNPGLGEDELVTIAEPRSPTSEAYRALRTNVNFSSVDRPLRTLMITSPGSKEGKTTVACNLGVVMAQDGKSVILSDCDFRLPKTHAYFGVTNRFGLSTLFSEALDSLETVTQSTEVNGLKLVTTGALPPNPAELLGSKRMHKIFETMKQNADVIIIDSPPILAVTDAVVLAPNVDGVLIVVYPGNTKLRGLEWVVTQLRQVNAPLLGVVMNKLKTRGYGYGYDYYYKDKIYHEYYEKKRR